MNGHQHASSGCVIDFSRQHHDDTSDLYTCFEQKCMWSFSHQYTLTEHMKSHTGERPHICPVKTCAKSFSTSGNLSRHKRLHGYIEPLPCPVQGCVCTFPSNNKLEKHMKFHFANDVKVCLVPGCGKTFSTTGNLNRHVKTMHGDNENSCTSPTASIATSYTSYSPTAADQWSTLDRATSGYFEPEALWTHAPLPYQNDQSIMDDPWSDEDVLDALAVFIDEPESELLGAVGAFSVEDYCNVSVFESSLQFARSR